MDKNKIIKEVKKLKLPLGKYVVVGSGIMAARGIREYKDIDILVTDDVFKKLAEDGNWKIAMGEGKRNVLKNGKYEMDKIFWCKDYKPDTKTLIKNAEIINGIPFLPLSELIKFKKTLGRKKDLDDIELIEQYMKSNNKKQGFNN